MKVWVLTYELNQYDQFDEYFAAVFSKKPTVEQVMFYDYAWTEDQILRALKGGRGRTDEMEYSWPIIRTVEI